MYYISTFDKLNLHSDLYSYNQNTRINHKVSQELWTQHALCGYLNINKQRSKLISFAA